jgi:hypothetical protein
VAREREPARGANPGVTYVVGSAPFRRATLVDSVRITMLRPSGQ